jgi:hypothetical protein
VRSIFFYSRRNLLKQFFFLPRKRLYCIRQFALIRQQASICDQVCLRLFFAVFKYLAFSQFFFAEKSLSRFFFFQLGSKNRNVNQTSFLSLRKCSPGFTWSRCYKTRLSGICPLLEKQPSATLTPNGKNNLSL